MQLYHGFEIEKQDPDEHPASALIRKFPDFTVADLLAVKDAAKIHGEDFLREEAQAEISYRNRIDVPWVHDDGGRSAYFIGERAGDCVVRAFAICLERDYKEVYDRMAELNQQYGGRKYKTARDGVSKQAYKRYAGFETDLVWHPLMGIGTGCTVHLRPDELPMGRIICRVTKHMVAVIDGVIHDTYDCSREGTRCVYGYYKI